MKDLIDQYAMQIITLAIVMTIAKLISHLALKLLSSMKSHSTKIKGKLTTFAMSLARLSLLLAPHLFVMGFCFFQLRSLVQSEAPPSRLDSAMISFWMFWLLLMFVRSMFDTKLWTTGKDGSVT